MEQAGKLKVSIKNNQSQIKIPSGIRLLIRRCCHAVLISEGFTQDAEVSVSFVSNEEIRSLNKSYRSKDSVTDVLSFPLTDEDGTREINTETGYVQLGDIVISIETALRQAEIYGHSLTREIGFLTVHSMLHLLGYDHEKSPLDERIMREKEESVLDKLGISRELTFTDQPEE